MSNQKYSVNYWGSHPDNENDDCWTGKDFDNLFDAMEFYRRPVTDRYCKDCTSHIELVGPSVCDVRENPDYDADKVDRASLNEEWRREQAMQSAMCNGCEGWNDYYG